MNIEKGFFRKQKQPEPQYTGIPEGVSRKLTLDNQGNMIWQSTGTWEIYTEKYIPSSENTIESPSIIQPEKQFQLQPKSDKNFTLQEQETPYTLKEASAPDLTLTELTKKSEKKPDLSQKIDHAPKRTKEGFAAAVGVLGIAAGVGFALNQEHIPAQVADAMPPRPIVRPIEHYSAPTPTNIPITFAGLENTVHPLYKAPPSTIVEKQEVTPTVTPTVTPNIEKPNPPIAPHIAPIEHPVAPVAPALAPEQTKPHIQWEPHAPVVLKKPVPQIPSEKMQPHMAPKTIQPKQETSPFKQTYETIDLKKIISSNPTWDGEPITGVTSAVLKLDDGSTFDVPVTVVTDPTKQSITPESGKGITLFMLQNGDIAFVTHSSVANSFGEEMRLRQGDRRNGYYIGNETVQNLKNYVNQNHTLEVKINGKTKELKINNAQYIESKPSVVSTWINDTEMWKQVLKGKEKGKQKVWTITCAIPVEQPVNTVMALFPQGSAEHQYLTNLFDEVKLKRDAKDSKGMAHTVLKVYNYLVSQGRKNEADDFLRRFWGANYVNGQLEYLTKAQLKTKGINYFDGNKMILSWEAGHLASNSSADSS